MPAFYSASVPAFLAHEEDLIIGKQTRITKQGISELSVEQLEAWRNQLPILRDALRAPCAQGWHLLLEYPIPRRAKRIDVVILAKNLILVLEFKCGARKYERDACVQVEDYCLDLRDFHEQSHCRTIVPILVATDAPEVTPPLEEVTDSVAPVWLANRCSLGKVLTRAVGQYQSCDSHVIDPQLWDTGEYAPTPTILEAARALYEGQSVREISRCHAGADNLTQTSEAVMRAIRQARENNRKIICFVTGVPGAGKTLAGLNIVHSRELHEGSLGAFLSGNGPLVRVLTEALARDHCGRTQARMAESRRCVSTFIQNVHRFIDAHFSTSIAPQDRVIIFDEAQRAWNATQSKRKFGRDKSEPEIMLEVMNRHAGWSVIVALVGTGQEINTGEAGLSEWGRATIQRFPNWTVLISPLLLAKQTIADDALFDRVPSSIELIENPTLHLQVCLRSYKAQKVSEFVSHVLLADSESARSVLASCTDFPIVLTRDVQKAREWLKRHQRGSRRIGLIASSGGRRLKAYGLDVRSDLEVENWFLNSTNDVRSSYYLEMPATEFGIQGLELDWTGLCWDLDLIPADNGWRVQAFKGTKWQLVRDQTRRNYVVNKYRVLLTRAREGMIIWVPRGDRSDWTRPSKNYDLIAQYLRWCGLVEI